ncbi:baeRF3 domain-containing protein [Thermomonospora amylolytica]|uniref:baeRF3 domain-containing protein n=1 Tax=Thermomonospora amylolytica TaxID=1411117 RepID=UPI000E6C3FF0|nr:hypothetical protein [Thermomonospora amylolytica]
MDAVTLSELRKPRPYPAVSVLLPVHRRGPSGHPDPDRLRDLLAEARRRLEDDPRVPPATVDDVMDGLRQAADRIDLGHAREGVALYAAPDGERHAFTLDQPPVEERVVVDHTFATRDLVAAHTRTTRYWLLVLADRTRLWDCRPGGLTEVVGGPFPMARRPDAGRDFHRAVTAALGRVNGRDPRPVIVAGTTRDQAFFEEAAHGSIILAGRVDGDHHDAGAAELAELVHPVLAAYEDLREVAVLTELEAARSLRRYASGLADVARLAEEGRGAHLVVERGYYAPAVRSAEGALIPVDRPHGDAVEDAVDRVIETVLEYGGEVTLVSDGFLVDHARIALVVRY